MEKRDRILLTMFVVVFSFIHTPVVADELSPTESMAEFCNKLPRSAYKSLERIDYESEWFEVYRVAAGVFAIYEPFQWQEVISYLIEGENKALLFDTGNGIEDISIVVKNLTDKPIAVLNSHSHYDHVGGNFAFDIVYGMNTPFTQSRQKGVKNKNIAIELSAGALCKQPPSGLNAKNHVGKPYKVTEPIEDGSIIDLGNRELEVLHIPGHTPDSIALIDRDAGLMWTGDSYYSGPIWLYAPETNLKDYRASLDRLVAEIPDLKALLPAHNTPWVEPSVLQRALSTFKQMLDNKIKRHSNGDGTATYQSDGESTFSFLTRDEPLPYR